MERVGPSVAVSREGLPCLASHSSISLQQLFVVPAQLSSVLGRPALRKEAELPKQCGSQKCHHETTSRQSGNARQLTIQSGTRRRVKSSRTRRRAPLEGRWDHLHHHRRPSLPPRLHRGSRGHHLSRRACNILERCRRHQRRTTLEYGWEAGRR